MPFSGAEQLRAVARDLKVAGTPARGLGRSMRRNIVAAVTPMVVQVQSNARSIPTTGTRSTGLREALANATRVAVAASARKVAVSLVVDGKRMPAGQQALPQLMEGEKPWRHPVGGDTSVWVDQESHAFVAPAIPPTVLRAAAGVDAAVAETALLLSKGTP